jgi:hypothetical protein
MDRAPELFEKGPSVAEKELNEYMDEYNAYRLRRRSLVIVSNR